MGNIRSPDVLRPIARDRKYMMNYNSGYYVKLDRNTELARAINVMMAQVKRIYILL